MRNPDTGEVLTDRLGNELGAGDRILAPIRRRTNIGGAQLVEAVIERIDPLVEKPGQWLSTSNDSVTPLVRVSQVGQKRATEYLDSPPANRASVITARHLGRALTIRYNDCVKLP